MRARLIRCRIQINRCNIWPALKLVATWNLLSVRASVRSSVGVLSFLTKKELKGDSDEQTIGSEHTDVRTRRHCVGGEMWEKPGTQERENSATCVRILEPRPDLVTDDTLEMVGAN